MLAVGKSMIRSQDVDMTLEIVICIGDEVIVEQVGEK